MASSCLTPAKVGRVRRIPPQQSVGRAYLDCRMESTLYFCKASYTPALSAGFGRCARRD